MQASLCAGWVFRRSDDIVSRSVEDERILVPLVSSGDQVDSIYTLNEVGAFVWDRIDGALNVCDLLGVVKAEFDGSEEDVDRAVLTFLDDLVEIEAIVQK